jgi:RNA polymerase sigma-70 factor (ECF subfamily)
MSSGGPRVNQCQEIVMSELRSRGNVTAVRSLADNHSEESTERELIGRIASGDRSAMDRLYVGYYSQLLNFFAILTTRADLVEELIVATMLKVWRERATIEEKGTVAVWIMSIAYSYARNLVRDVVGSHRQAQPPVPHPNHGGRSVAPVEMSSHTHDLLLGLPGEQRAALHLAYAGGFSRQDIANIMQISGERIQMLLTDARGRLRP